MHPLAQNLLGGFQAELLKQAAASPRFMPSLNVKGVPAAVEAKQWAKYRQATADRPAALESARHRIQVAKEKGVPMSFNVKGAAAPAQMAAQAAAPAAKTLASKLVAVLQKRPLLTAATAAAAGAGAATGVAQAKARKEGEDRRREQVRQLLMSRLSEGGYVTG
jgi:hypothetical protein